MMRERFARLISNVLNPFVISSVIIILLAFHDAADTGAAIKWSLVSLALSVLPVLVIVAFMVRRNKIDGFFTNPRHQRNSVYIFAALMAIISYSLLWYLNAPDVILAVFISGMAAIIVFMVINYFWKISLHTAFVAASVAVLIMVYGVQMVWTVVLVPLVAWARLQLKQHSPAQVMTGGLLAVVIVVGVFWGFGVAG
jgi:membrane-associated phospholipid phosphatase